MKRRNKSTDGGRASEAGPADDLKPGTVLGKYRIVERLGSGGMGSVYRAVHTGIAKAVALKTMSPQLAADPRTAARFLREAASASRLDHPHVVGVTDFGTDHGTSYLVMELLRGEDLGALIARSPGGLPTVMVADTMLAVCAGVFAAHESGVVHRDLKPPNIFLSQTSLGETVPKVLDFGISKMIEEDGSSPLTNTGMVMGTTHYLSSEQVAGKPADVRSDQYALGVILYESLTGQRPFSGTSAYEIMRNISEGNYPAPRSLRPDLSSAFEAVVMRAMALDPNNRFESLHGLGRALLPFASSKRRVIWADYYERDSGRTSDPRLSARAAESGETIALQVDVRRPAQLSPTRTHFAPSPLPPAAPSAVPASETGVVGFPDSLSTGDYRALGVSTRKRRWVPALLFAVGAGLGAISFWKVPALRAKLPEAVRTALERAPASTATAVAEAPGTARPQAPAVEAAPVAVAPAQVRNANPRISPFATSDRTSTWPFEPPSKEDLAALAQEKDAGIGDAGTRDAIASDSGGSGQDAPRGTGRPAPAESAPLLPVVVAPRKVPPNPDRELPVVYPLRARRPTAVRATQGGAPAGTRRSATAPASDKPTESAPPSSEPSPVPPEEIPARKHFPAGGFPILD